MWQYRAYVMGSVKRPSYYNIHRHSPCICTIWHTTSSQSCLLYFLCHPYILFTCRITKFRNEGQKARKRQILKTSACVKDLEALHEDYVLVPADKAGNNVIVVCKHYYKEILTKELTTKNSSASTYTRSSVPIKTLVSSHINFMHRNNIRVPEEFSKLPFFYWLPKLHKNPYKHRFIAASSACTTKPLSKLLTHYLQLVLRHYKEYWAGIER